jgi:hypothetical protein
VRCGSRSLSYPLGGLHAAFLVDCDGQSDAYYNRGIELTVAGPRSAEGGVAAGWGGGSQASSRPFGQALLAVRGRCPGPAPALGLARSASADLHARQGPVLAQVDPGELTRGPSSRTLGSPNIRVP